MGNSDSKARFRGQLEVLGEKEVGLDETDFWEELWQLPTSAQDVFETLQPSDVRKLLSDQPTNLSTLLENAVSQLRLNAENPSVANTPRVLNCVRILTRCVPCLLEEESAAAEAIFWDLPRGEEKKSEPTSGETLARRLLRSVGELLFTEGFAVGVDEGTVARRAILESRQGGGGASDAAAAEVAATGAVPVRSAQLWAPGLGGLDIRPVAAAGFEANRAECLRLLLVCASQALYGTQRTYVGERNRWLRELCSPDFPHHAELLCSLLNTALSYDAVGWGVPYAEVLLGSDNTKLALVHNSMHLLLVLLDFDLRILALPEGTASASVMVPPSIDATETGNVHRATLGLVGRTQPKQLDWMIDATLKLLRHPSETGRAYLPHSQLPMPFAEELLVLVWHSIALNRDFVERLLTRGQVTDLVGSIMFFLWQGRTDQSKIGTVHVCTFILLVLSGERNFGVSLNRPFPANSIALAGCPLFTGSFADLLVIVTHKLVVNSTNPEKVETLYSCFLTILCNVSPYLKNISLVAAVKLAGLFELFANPKFLRKVFEELAHIPEDDEPLFRSRHAHSPTTETAQQAGAAGAAAAGATGEVNKDVPPSEEAHDPAAPTATEAAEARRAAESAAAQATGGSVKNPTKKTPLRKKFVPTHQWVRSWKSRMNTAPITRLLQVERLVREQGANDRFVVAYIKDTTMVGLLPVPHPIVIRKYQPNRHTNLWFTTFVWGLVFLRNQKMPIFDGEKIKLFSVHVVETTS